MNNTEFDQFILANMPHFIAVNYHRLLEAKTHQEYVERALHIYNLGLRALTIGLVSQYLIRDRERVSDPYLNNLIQKKFPRLTLDAWQQLFFTTLRVYEGNRELFFIPELYDFYWDTSSLPHTPRTDVERPFSRLTQISMELQTGQLLPREEINWNNLAKEIMELLQHYLQDMAFIGKYALICVLDSDELSYKFALHKGLTITIDNAPLPGHIELTHKSFYLRKGTEEFLHLQPFLVFWEEETRGDELVSTDIGVYDRFVYERLQYLLTTLGRTILDDRNITEFITLIFETIEDIKRKHLETEKLTWWQLHDICTDITQNRMAAVWNKYRPELYLQRNKTHQAFEQFLRLEKKCFVLIGKSGIGKSNFLLALGEELRQSYGDDTCVLMYDGAHLSVEPSITETISRDFDNRLNLKGKRIHEIWREINQIDDIETRAVILCVDAINENPQAKELLQQLNELLMQPWSWLKVVFSSRPETWKAIKRGVKLAESKYYREKDTEALSGVELEPFSYSERMEIFSQEEELPAAFAKYQQAFNIQTDYEFLSRKLRELLRDPLSLWLVANTYQGQKIPEVLKSMELIEQYIYALIRTERLHAEDLKFLEKRLVPLMAKTGQYSNVMTIGDIDAAGGGLFEAVYSEATMSDGRRLNQSFTNLVDADILSEQMEGREQKISFKYERFYDYFVGKYLFETIKSKSNKTVFIEELTTNLKEKLFLWGALRQLFIELLETKEYELVEQLGETRNEFQADLLVSVLTEYYPQYQTTLHPILIRWLEKPYQNTLSSRIAANVAIACLIEDILKRIVIHPNEKIRFLVVQEVHKLWNTDAELIIRVLVTLPEHFSVLRIRKAREILNTLLYASALLVLRDYSRVGSATRTIGVVQSLWKPIIEKLFLVSQNRFIEWGTKRLRRLMVRIGIGIAMNFIRNIEREGFTFSVKDIEAFFPATESRKEILKRLIPHFEAAVGQAPESVKALTEYIAEIAHEGEDNFFLYEAAVLGLIAHAKADLVQTAQAFEILLERLKELHPPTKDIASPNASIWHTIIGSTFTPLTSVYIEQEVAKQVLPIAARSLRVRELHCFNRYRLGSGVILRIENLGNAILGYAFNVPEAGHDLVKEITRIEVERGDHKQLRSQPSTLAVNMVRHKMPEAGLEALYDFIQTVLQTGYLHQFDKQEQEAFWQEMADNLIQRMDIYRDYLLDFLEKFKPGELPDAFSVRIRNARWKDSITINIGEAVMMGFSDALQDPNPFLRDSLKWVFYTAMEAKNLTALIMKSVFYLFDLLYPGESLFGKSTKPHQQNLSSKREKA